MVLLIFVVLVWNIAAQAPAHAAEAHQHAAEASQKAEYYCPMHPQIIQDKPGQCPICFMNLVHRSADQVPASASSMPTHAVIHPSASALSMLGIQTEKVVKRPLHKTLRMPGFVVHDQELFDAQVEHIKTIWSQKQTDKDLYKSIGPRWYSLGPKPKESTRINLMRLGMDEESIDALTPSSRPDFRLLHLKEMPDESWIYAPALTGDAALVKKGDPVVVESEALPGVPIKASVEGVAPFADRETRTVRIRILTHEKGAHLVPETPVIVSVHAMLGEAVAVPETAVLHTGEREFVFVKNADGAFEPVPVRTGRKADGYYEVLEGLSGGETAVVNGTFFLDSESRLQATFLKVDAGSASAGGHVHD